VRAALLETYGVPLVVVDDLTCKAQGPRQVKVRITHSGICHSDVHMGGGFTPAPLVPGHEAAGVVESVGSAVTTVSAGDRVVVAPMPSCGRCRSCLNGHPSVCVTTRGWIPGVLEDGRAPYEWRGQDVRRGNGVGAWSEYALIDETAAIAVPDDIPLELACVLGCAVQTGVGAVLNTARVPAGASVLVMGLGGIGVSIVQGARIAGATTIIASDPVAERRAGAEKFGATHVVDPGVDDVVRIARDVCGGVDFAFDAAGSPKTVTTGFKSTGIGGTVVLVGTPRTDDVLEGIAHGLIVGQEKRIIGSMMGSGNPARDIPNLVALWRSGALDLESMVTRTRPLEEVAAGLADLSAGSGLRTVLEIGDHT